MVKLNTSKIMQSHYRIDDMRMFHRDYTMGSSRITRHKVTKHTMNRWLKAKWRRYVEEIMPSDDESGL